MLKADTITAKNASATQRNVIIQGHPSVTFANSNNAFIVKDRVIDKERHILTIEETFFVRPLYVLDKVVISQEQFELLDKNTIASISVLKNQSATALYGNAGANGVIVLLHRIREM